MNATTAPPPLPPLDTHNRWPPPPRRMWLGVFGGPLAWGLQLGLGWFVTGSACLGGEARWGALTPQAVGWVQFGVALLCLSLALAALGVGIGAWRHSSNPGLSQIHAPERPDFLAAAALLVSSVFLLAIVWTGLAQLWLPLCERIR